MRVFFESEVLHARLYDGMRFTIDAPVVPEPINTRWLENTSVQDRRSTPATSVTVTSGAQSTPVPLDYEIRVSAAGADTSNSLTPSSRIPTNFTVWDVTNLNNTRQVPFQITEVGALIPADTVKGVLSPGDVVNVRVAAVILGGYPFYAQSTWRFTLGLSDEANAFMVRSTVDSRSLYDSLAVRQVRGMQRRPVRAVAEYYGV